MPPRITAGPSPVVAVTSEAVTLRCDATGSPAPALLWLKDGNPVPEEVAGGPQVRWLPPGGGGVSLGASFQKDALVPCSGFSKNKN